MKKLEKEQQLSILAIFIAVMLTVAAVFTPDASIVKLILFLVAYAVVGGEVIFEAIKNIFNGKFFDENFLMSIATIGALCIGDYPEAVAVMVFYKIGELFEDIAVGRSRESIASLMDIRPDSATVLKDGNEIKVKPEEVELGDLLVVRPGEKIPVDCTVVKGASSVNTSALTGESLPRDIAEGDAVFSGSINLSSLISVRTDKIYSESTVAKILELIEKSSEKKAKSEAFITRFAKIYTPGVVLAAALLAVLPPLILHDEFMVWFERALTFLVVSCPCALVISVPLTFFGGIGGASRKGILIKGANYLELLAKVSTAVFDKTGTLTKGNFTVTAVHPEKLDENELIEIAAAAESYSNHPIALSINRAYGKKHIPGDVTDEEDLPGMGIKVKYKGKIVYAGNGKLMDKIGADWHECHKTGTVVHVAFGEDKKANYMGHIVISDEVKPEAKKAVKELRALGVRQVVMLTGDNKAVGDEVAKELKLDEAYSNLLPDDKVRITEEIIKKNRVQGKSGGSIKRATAFVGDGINDAPVLGIADVGVAMGALGSDAAIEAADVVLTDDNPRKLALAIRIAKYTISIVKQNIAFAISVKLITLALSAFGLVDMWVAVVADVGVMVIAVLNAMRALSQKQD